VTVQIRYGKPEERVLLEDLQRRASLAVERYRADLLQHPEAIHLPLAQLQEQRVRVAELGGQITGFSALLPGPVPGPAGVQQLDGLFVEPQSWRRGIGRALIEDAARCARAEGAAAIDVVANEDAQAFYARLGFVSQGVIQTQFGPGTSMRYAL
jgi:GNAT superfamily N-acetyltransferase